MKNIIKTIFMSIMIFNLDVNARTKQDGGTKKINVVNRFSEIANRLRDLLKRKSIYQYNYAFINGGEIQKLNKKMQDVLKQCKNDEQIKAYGTLIDVFLTGNANRILVIGTSLQTLFHEYFKNIEGIKLRNDIATEMLNYKILYLFYGNLNDFADKYTVSDKGSVSDFCNMIIDNIVTENVPDILVSNIKDVNTMVSLIAKIMTLYRNLAIVASQLTNNGIVELNDKTIMLDASTLLNISDQDLISKIEILLQSKLTKDGIYTKDMMDEYTKHNGRKLLQEKILEHVIKYQKTVATQYQN